MAAAAATPEAAADAASAAGGPEAATLGASSTLIVNGDQMQLSGAVSGDASCQDSRAVELEWRPADSSAWALVGTGTAGGDGSYGFTDGQQYTGAYRVSLPVTASCQAVVSDPVGVRVRALVDSTLLASSLTAGSCLELDVTVRPDKAGQNVVIERRTASGWQTVDTLTLDGSSFAQTSPCFGWEDVGVVRLRARWPQQDDLNAPGTGIVLAFQISEAPWMKKIGELVAGHAVSVSVGDDGSFLYQRADTSLRIPASNEKLLLSMALLDTLGPGHVIATRAAAASVEEGVVQGDLWVLGRGDPEITAAGMAALAGRLVDAGVTRVQGSVMGSTGFFRHDWWAEGWKVGRTRLYVAPPTALTFEGNTTRRGFTRNPEVLAARSLTKQLEKQGVAVRGTPGSGPPPDGLTGVAAIASRPLPALLTFMNRLSDNFYAEVLGKLLGASAAGPPGTIAKGAGAIRAWVATHGVEFTLYDSSGLSYANRVTAQDILRLLWVAGDSPWGDLLRQTLPAGGQGTLEDRLTEVRVRAKTGTLDEVSALSGWVWLELEGAWAEFSILSAGMPKWQASRIEDRIVRLLTSSAH